MKWPWQRKVYLCPRCRDTGMITTEEIIPNSELADWQIAYNIVEGGHFYRPVSRPCDSEVHANGGHSI